MTLKIKDSGFPSIQISLTAIIVIFMLIVPEHLSAQSINSLDSYKILNQALPGEKIFLHVDRPNYLHGDTIWFKAYTWFGYDQKPDTISRVLHVDLLSASGKIEQSRKLLIQNGASFGEFGLDKSISPGKYTLRAYTKWMQNPNSGDPFYQTVTISAPNQDFISECNPVLKKQTGNDSLFLNLRFYQINHSGDFDNKFNYKLKYTFKIKDQLIDSGQISATGLKEQKLNYSLSQKNGLDSLATFELTSIDSNLTYNNKFNISLLDAVDLQFFPEGGSMVTGLESIIAFKAIGPDGLSREVKGIIETADGNFVTSFESSHRGMGIFKLRPEAGTKYNAHILYHNRNNIIPLPVAGERGSVIAVQFDADAGKLYLTLKNSQSEINTQKYIAGSAYGNIIFAFPFRPTIDSSRIIIPSNLLSEGILRLTVLDSLFKPECERLIYVDKNQRFKITITPDSLSVGTRSKVTIKIKTTNPDGTPIEADLSLAIVDKSQIIIDKDIHGISAYKLLESELQGNIEDPDYYFRNDSCINRNNLDLVLLTHGYRRFLTTDSNFAKPNFAPERSYDVSGEIKKVGNFSRVNKYNYSDIGLILICASSKPYFELSKPDSLGRFAFSLPLQYGSPTSLIQVNTPKGKPFYCNILLTEAKPPPRFIRTLKPQYPSTSILTENLQQLQAVRKTEISKAPWEGAMTGTLGEITVTAKAKNWYQDFGNEALKISDLDSLDPTGKKFQGLYELLVKEFGGRYERIRNGSDRTVWFPVVSLAPNIGSDWFPIYVINGKTFLREDEPGEQFYSLLDQLAVFPVNEIQKIMVLPPGNIAAHYASPSIGPYVRQSLVVIETYSNNTFRGDPTGIKTFIVDGLDVPRIFYSPRYEGPAKYNPIFDGRPTIFWNPSIKTDQNGQADVEFYTSDTMTEMGIVINGIQLFNGITGHTKMTISSSTKK